ncbi:hypothetical protein [Fuscibacter oryzae]|uniref:hypothetical protein n=1 Tax=Fuscibacter oryzae TaxID=2803939 RepID=UPI00192C804A|nr:hypothetical protein [Fuscibacter oryzae]
MLDFGEVRVLAVLVANVVPRPVAGKVAQYHEGDGPNCAEDGDKIRLDILAFGTTKERMKLSCSVSLLWEGKPYQSFKPYTCFNGKVPADGVLMKAGGHPLIYYHDNDPGGNWTVQIDVTEKASGRTARATAGYFKDCQPE